MTGGTNIKSAGYARTSTHGKKGTNEQNIETQIYQLKKQGIDKRDIFYDEGISGSISANERPGFQNLIKHVEKEGIDIIYTFEISRLGRTFFDTLQILMDMEQRGIRIISLSPNETWTDITDPNLRGLFFSIFSWVAENEKRALQERIKIGVERAKKENGTWGRPRKEPNKRIVMQHRARGLTWAEVARVMNIPPSTLYKYRDQWKREEEQEKIQSI